MNDTDLSFQLADGSDFHLAYLAAKSYLSKSNFIAAYDVTKAALKKQPKNISFLELYVQSLLGLNCLEDAAIFFSWLGANIYKTTGLSIAYFDFLAMERKYGELFLHVWNSVKANQSDDFLSYLRVSLENFARMDSGFISSFEDLSYSDLNNPLESILISFNELEVEGLSQSFFLQNNSHKNLLRDGLLGDPTEIARGLFSSQQAEMTSAAAKLAIATLPYRPLVSIIMPVYNSPVKWMRRAVESLQEQFYTNWELCVVDDGSPSKEHLRILSEMAKDDSRIRLAVKPTNGGISAASNLALEMARGEFFALVDHDDEITADALLRMVEAINADPKADFLYSDECKICDTPARRLFDFVLKPDWSPEIMLNFMLTGHLTVYRSALVREIGGFRSAYDFSQDYDLALRMSEVSRSIVHVERILYLWRAVSGSAASGGKGFARVTNIAALADALVRREIPGTVEIGPHANRVRIALPAVGARVSIVIPSDSAENLRLALDAIHNGTHYHDYEVLVVCNSSVAAELERTHTAWPAAKFVRYDKPYNFSDKCNVGAEAAEGDIIVFYNDDVFPIVRDWIERLIEYLWIPGVGATSPQLLYKDGTIQYSGMISGTPGMVGTAYHRLPLYHYDSFHSLNQAVRNISILSGACCAIRRDLFLKVGGFDPVNTPDGHSDLDLSYKVLEAGFRCVYTPYALLTHVGNHSWNTKPRKYKADIFCLKRWGRNVSRDPYFTPSMCKVLYRDFVFDYRIYAEGIDSAQIYTGPDVLFVSHELTHTGAPHMVLEAAKAVKAAGGFPVVVAPADGPLRVAFEEEKIVTIIDASLNARDSLFENFAKNFDIVVLSTFVLKGLAEQLVRNNELPIIWWLHESAALATLSDVSIDIWHRVTAVCNSRYSSSFLPPSVKAEILTYGIKDNKNEFNSAKPNEKFNFTLIGTIEPRKGQDIFIDAISKLPSSIRSKCTFTLAGKLWHGNHDFWEPLRKKLESIPSACYVGDVSHAEALALINACDVLVSSSRDEAFSIVAIEAAQFSRPTILSDHVGAREILGDSSSLVFPVENTLELRDKMIQLFSDRGRVLEMGIAARKIYETQLSAEVFSENFLDLIDKTLKNSNSNYREFL
jgi:O-antigen biosynthesis protein